MTRIHNLDSFYTTINKHIKLTEAYTGSEGLSETIKMCRLKPRTKSTNSKKITLIKWWVDEYGNSLKIVKGPHGNKPQVFLDDPAIAKEKFICTDLYACLPLDKVARMSILLYLLVGKDREGQDHAVLAFLGMDRYVRAFALIEREWKQIAPLQLGLRVLRMLGSDIERRNCQSVGSENKVIWPCVEQKAWLCLWGARGKTLSIIKQYGYLMDALKLQGEE